MDDPLISIYSEVGSEEPFYRLVEKFYQGVEKDSLLRPMYPDDLNGPIERLAQFLIQRMGGATTYSDLRGHPRMRARHMKFPIDQKARDAWMIHMTNALNEVPEFEAHKETLIEFFDNFSTFMINKAG